MTPTQQNLEVLERALGIWNDGIIPRWSVSKRERYHLSRLVETGHLRYETLPDEETVSGVDLGGGKHYVYTGKLLGLPYAGVFRAMRDRLRSGEAKDVSAFEVEGGDYRLPKGFFEEGLDYCDAKRQAWIWSIGRHRETGVVWASRTGGKYQNPAFECLWLR